MKKRRISRIAISFILTLSMLLSLPLYLCAADMTGEHIECIGISPDQRYLLEIRSIVTIHEDESMTYNGAHYLAVCDTQTGKVIRSIQSVPNYKPTFDGIRADAETFGCGVHWSDNSRFCAVDMPHDPEYGASVLLFDTKRMTSLGLVHSSDLYQWIYEHDTALDLPDSDTITLNTPFVVEKWSGNTVRLLCEFDLGDGRRMWARHTQDMEQMRVLNTEWGDALDLDDPMNPIWKRTEALPSPDNNQGYRFDTPDNRYCITVETAYLRSNPETWNNMYESVHYSENGFVREEYHLDLMHTAWAQGLRYDDRPLWNHLSLKLSPDSRYLIAESADVGAYPFYIDLDTERVRILPSAETRLDAVSRGAVKVYTEAFSVFGDALLIVCEEDGSRSREIFDLETGKIASAQAGMADDAAFAYTEHELPSSLRDAFRGFTAVSKTHTNGLDGLFRVGDDYMYLHMEHGENLYSTKLYREYVHPVSVIDTAFEGYRVLYSREGCWVLDENETTVYAGTGFVKSCGAFALAINQDMVNPIDSIVTDRTLFDADFHLLVKHVLDTAPQSDGSVYVSHTIGRGAFAETYLSHIAADGTIMRIGAYDGDLSEFRG